MTEMASKNGTKRYAIVGTGGRARAFIDAILGKYSQEAELVGMCDLSRTRLNYHLAENKRLFPEAPAIACFTSDQFDQMVKTTRPDVVIVSTMDCLHHHYLIRAMDLGCDAISEKPMTVDAEKARAILDAIARTRRHLRVTFNYRYQNGVGEVKRLVLSGAIGKPMAVDFAWMLDTSHGADYFRRWHREKDKSGGLLVHKASHHFDLINWWIASYAQKVFCMGDLKFYGKKNAELRGQKYSYQRYTGEAKAKDDPFALTLDSDETLRKLYLEAEADSGYIRDRNVMGEPITIEDTMAITARYRNGAILNYSLIAYSPWEGLRVAITGDKGRLEFFEKHSSHIIMGKSNEGHEVSELSSALTLYPMFKPPRNIEIPPAAGPHGGGDERMLEAIFRPNGHTDPLHRDATHVDGLASIIVGIAANQSIATGMPVECDEIIRI
jgi:predicted dehydrogenase